MRARVLKALFVCHRLATFTLHKKPLKWGIIVHRGNALFGIWFLPSAAGMSSAEIGHLIGIPSPFAAGWLPATGSCRREKSIYANYVVGRIKSSNLPRRNPISMLLLDPCQIPASSSFWTKFFPVVVSQNWKSIKFTPSFSPRPRSDPSETKWDWSTSFTKKGHHIQLHICIPAGCTHCSFLLNNCCPPRHEQDGSIASRRVDPRLSVQSAANHVNESGRPTFSPLFIARLAHCNCPPLLLLQLDDGAKVRWNCKITHLIAMESERTTTQNIGRRRRGGSVFAFIYEWTRLAE